MRRRRRRRRQRRRRGGTKEEGQKNDLDEEGAGELAGDQVPDGVLQLILIALHHELHAGHDHLLPAGAHLR